MLVLASIGTGVAPTQTTHVSNSERSELSCRCLASPTRSSRRVAKSRRRQGHPPLTVKCSGTVARQQHLWALCNGHLPHCGIDLQNVKATVSPACATPPE